MKIFICSTCKNQFESKKLCKSRIPKYCSKVCYSKREITTDTKKKMSEAKKWKTPWNKKWRFIKNCEECKKEFINIDGWVYKQKYCSIECKNEASKKIDYSYIKWEKSHFWRWWVCSKNELERKSWKYRNWRKSVFIRDNFTCVTCKQRWWYLQADHIKSFAYFQDLRYDISNWRTLCIDCHKKTETFWAKNLKLRPYKNLDITTN